MDQATLNDHVERVLDGLGREFADEIPPDQVTSVGRGYFDQLRAEARIDDFIPVLVYRFTREELRRCGRDELSHAA
jgi:hypothetical protein